jgi:precorrin-2 dehydrogenase
MTYYPVFLDIHLRPCLVIGGGAVGSRKVDVLVENGAQVTVVSPDVTDRLDTLSQQAVIVLKKRLYRSSDLDGMFLVIGATDDEALNRRISEDAEKRQILCNIVDRPEICSFIVPAIVKRGDLILAISTSGKSPAFAKKLRKELAQQFGEEYGQFLQLMGAIRRKLLAGAHEPEAHKHLFNQIIDEGLLDMIRENKKERINAVLMRILGEGFDIDTLLHGSSPDRLA